MVRTTHLNFWDGRYSFAFFFFVSVCCLMVSTVRPSAFDGPRAQAMEMFGPVVGAFSHPFQEAASTIEEIAGISDIRAEMADLKQENIRLRQWYQAALTLESENESLRELLNVKVNSSNRFVTARVLADSANAYVRSVLVGAGNADGVVKGQAVLSGEGLVGRVVEVSENVSRVLLLTDLNSRVPVLIEGVRKKAILVGNNSDEVSLEFLPEDVSLAKGSRVVTSGDGGLFPPGLPIGVISSALGDPVKISIFADLDDMIFVRVVDNPAMESGF